MTGDRQIQGAAMLSTEGVECVIDRGHHGLFVELLFTAPRNRHWIRRDHTERFRGVGIALLIAMAQESTDCGLEGRLKLESSPSFVTWYEKRGLQPTPERPILYEDVIYTPMELTAQAAKKLLSAV